MQIIQVSYVTVALSSEVNSGWLCTSCVTSSTCTN